MSATWAHGHLVDDETGEILKRDRKPAAKLLASSWYREALERSGKVRAGAIPPRPKIPPPPPKRRATPPQLFDA